MIRVNNLGKRVDTQEGELTILSDINFQINKAASVAITGESGSGKSTLLSLLAGLDQPTDGSIIIDDQQLSELDEDGLALFRATRIGFVFQSFHLLSSLTALENVMLPLDLAGQADAQQQALELLQRVGLKERVTHYPKQLSGGEQQRVAIARAFASNPTILFADEPTGNLDSKTGKTVADLLFELNQDRETTLVLVTHDEKLANRCQHQLILEAGKLISDEAEVNV
ncbi:MAG: ABC transporter ATP-binding protein [Gammaproteobacteria bacterium]|nr:ABC transporter ATP-binding protein [Gammaproteobacteria bacterium]